MRCLLFGLLFLSLSATGQRMTFVQNGEASFYHNKFNGRKTANGERFSNSKMTAAHLSLPFGTKVKVTNKKNSRSVIVRINDRGPYAKGRIIDLSRLAASKLGFANDGVTQVRVEVVSSATGTTPPTASAPKPASKSREFFALKSEKVKPRGYGVQVGSFRELDNIVRLTDGLGRKFDCRVIVEVAKVNGHKYYRVALATFPNKRRATRVAKAIKSDFPGAFVVTYTK